MGVHSYNTTFNRNIQSCQPSGAFAEIFLGIFLIILSAIHKKQQFYLKFLVDNALKEGGKLATLIKYA